jgi:hypothetical protein
LVFHQFSLSFSGPNRKQPKTFWNLLLLFQVYTKAVAAMEENTEYVLQFTYMNSTVNAIIIYWFMFQYMFQPL